MSGETVLEVLGRDHAVAILRGTEEPVGAPQLAEHFDIPVASCYRRLDELTAHGLVREFETVTENGQTVKRYERAVDDVHVQINRHQVDVAFGDRVSPAATLDRIWQRVHA